MNPSYLNRSFIIIILFVWSLPLFANSVGHVIGLAGQVSVTRAVGGTIVTANSGMEIFLNDSVVTDIDGQLKMLLRDQSVLTVGPDSKLSINELLIGEDKQQQTTINLLSGWIRAVVGKTLGGDSHYRVKTSVAVAGVRGTDFDVLIESPELTAVRCRDGEVLVQNIDPDVMGEILVQSNTYTVVERMSRPLPISAIAPGESLSQKVRKERQQKQEGVGSERDEKDRGIEKESEASISGDSSPIKIDIRDIDLNLNHTLFDSLADKVELPLTDEINTVPQIDLEAFGGNIPRKEKEQNNQVIEDLIQRDNSAIESDPSLINNSPPSVQIPLDISIPTL